MTALAIDVLQEVSEAGGTVRLEGDMLRLSAPEPLPDELRARLRQHKAEIVALLSAVKPANDAAPRSACRASPACRGRSPTASTPSSRPMEHREYRRNAGHGCNAMLVRLLEGGWAQQALDSRLDRGRPVRLRPASTVAPARPGRARPADRRA